ncbi:hypothetical protein T06_9460 [Trichinella sp. T6]|nr:hypothetical protein T06_9460 [Trichinella sp. T6]
MRVLHEMVAYAILRRQGRGLFTQMTDEVNSVNVVKWFKPFYCHQRSPGHNVPAVFEYNQQISGVDLSNMLKGLHGIDHKSRKWYKPSYRHQHLPVHN